MAYQKCVLGGYSYPINPVENQNPRVKKVVATETLVGRRYTDWGADPSRQEINQTWPTMPAAMFASLKAKAALGGTLSYTDDDGTVYTVIAEFPKYQRTTPGADAYLSVVLKLWVVSSP